MLTYRIHIIRHGMTGANTEGRYIGSTDAPLSEDGVKELFDLRGEGIYPDVEAIFSSPLSRCVQSAGIIYPDSEPVLVDGLRECSFGRFEGKTADELKDDEQFAQWLAGVKGVVPDGGEATPDFIMRSVAAFASVVEQLMRTKTRSAAVIAHGGTIMSVLSVCGIPERSFSEWMCQSGRGYTLLINPSIWMRGYKLEVIDTI